MTPLTVTSTNGASPNGSVPQHYRIAIIGSGFGGLGMAIRLKQAGIDDFIVLERADDVGGTWHANTYPGCQCDVPSHLYSFSFAPNPNWSRTYSHQAEIWDYLRDCAQRYGVTAHIRFGHEVRSATWQEERERWLLETSQGALSAQVVVTAPGGLSEPLYPDIPGLSDFQGAVFHSATWDHDHVLDNERVAVIGTGASAIQLIPRIRRRVGKLHVFQRTPPWILPHTDRPVTRFERWLFRTLPFTQRLVRKGIYWGRETFVPGFTVDQRIMRVPERIARAHLRRQVADPELRAKLTPHYRLGCKRVLLSNHYYPALSKPNVEVVTDGIEAVTANGIRTSDGTEREIDTIILGTGFHVTDIPFGQRVQGRGGRTLDEVWQGSPQAYLGATVAGFPNSFILLGPNTGLGHTSVVFMIEAQIEYVMQALRAMEQEGCSSIDVRPEVQSAFNARVQEQMQGTVWTDGGCASWYIDSTGRNTTLWPDFTWRFRRSTARFDIADYVVERNGHVPAPSSPAGTPVHA